MKSRTFGEWLREQLTIQRISQVELANKIGVTPAQVSRVLSGERQAASDTLAKIASAIKKSPIEVLRRAGILPPSPETEITADDWMFLLSELPPEEQEELRQLALLKIERAKRKRVGRSVRTDG